MGDKGKPCKGDAAVPPLQGFTRWIALPRACALGSAVWPFQGHFMRGCFMRLITTALSGSRFSGLRLCRRSVTLGQAPSPHFSPASYCGSVSGRVYCVALCRAPRHTVEVACGALGRAPCIHTHLRRLATESGEKCGLVPIQTREELARQRHLALVCW